MINNINAHSNAVNAYLATVEARNDEIAGLIADDADDESVVGKFDMYEESLEGYNRTLEDLRRQLLQANENNDKMTTEFKRQFLTGLLTRVEVMQSNMYSSRSWELLMKVYGITKPISLDDDANVADIEKAIRDLSGALNSLRKAEMDDTKHREGLPLTIKPGGTAYEQAAMSVAAGAVAKTIEVIV